MSKMLYLPFLQEGTDEQTQRGNRNDSSDQLFCYFKQLWFLKIGTEALPGQVDEATQQTKQGTLMEVSTACGCQGGEPDTVVPTHT